MALWDLLGKFLNEPVWRLLGYEFIPKTPIFRCFWRRTNNNIGTAKKLSKRLSSSKVWVGTNWKRNASEDQEHFQAAREGLGKEGILLVDTGQIFGDDVEKASQESRQWKRQMSYGLKNLFTPCYS